MAQFFLLINNQSKKNTKWKHTICMVKVNQLFSSDYRSMQYNNMRFIFQGKYLLHHKVPRIMYQLSIMNHIKIRT